MAAIGATVATLRSTVMSLLFAVLNDVYLIAAVLGQQQRAVFPLQQSDGTAPDFLRVGIGHESREEILLRARGLAVLERDEHDRIPGPLGPVRRAAQRDERAIAV